MFGSRKDECVFLLPASSNEGRRSIISSSSSPSSLSFRRGVWGMLRNGDMAGWNHSPHNVVSGSSTREGVKVEELVYSQGDASEMYDQENE